MTNRTFAWAGIVVLATVVGVTAADKKIQMKKLPQAVQQAVQNELKTATLVGLSEEKEDGKMFYEAETKVDGRTRDVLFDTAGTVVSVEQEIDLDAVPVAAKSALSSHGKVLKVESVTKGTTVTYEAEVEKNGKKSEVVVDASGSAVRP
jgi:uncharacterized membrane protein YkoI